MRIVSWNTNGLRGTINKGMWQPFIKAVRPDIICLQETKSEPEQLPKEFLDNGWYQYYSWSKLKKGYSGVAILSKQKPDRVEYGMGIPKFDDEGRVVISYFTNFMNFKNLALICAYFPNGGGGPHRLKYKLEFYDAFLKFVENLKKKHEVIFTGDVNTAHTAIDLARPKENEDNTGFLPIERAWLDKVVSHKWTDIFRHFYPDKKDAYTYWDQKTRARDRNVGWRIDYFFATPKVLSKIKKTTIHSDVLGSDHCPISIDL